MSSWQDELRLGESMALGKDIGVGDVISGNLNMGGTAPFIGRWNMNSVLGYFVKELVSDGGGFTNSMLVHEQDHEIVVNEAYLIDQRREFIVRKPCRRVTVEITSAELLPRDILEQDLGNNGCWNQNLGLAVTSVQLSNDGQIMNFSADNKGHPGKYACVSRLRRRVSREQHGKVSKGDWPHQCTLCGQASYNGIVSVTHKEPNPNCTAWRY